MSLADELREVHGLGAFSLLFGYDLEGDTDWTWHDVACAMADRIDAEVEKEVADLRGALHHLDDVNDELRAENRQLRGLVADMWDWTRGCETCDEHDPHGRYCLGHECRKHGRVIERLRALGVEVDE